MMVFAKTEIQRQSSDVCIVLDKQDQNFHYTYIQKVELNIPILGSESFRFLCRHFLSRLLWPFLPLCQMNAVVSASA